MARRTTAALVFLFAAETAFACGTCLTAALDLLLPPVLLWSLFSITWFVSNGIVRSATGLILPLQPRALGAIGIVVLGFIIGGAVFGPITILPLMFPPLYAFGRSVLQRRSAELPVRVIGYVHVLAAGVLIALMTHTLRTRSEAEFISQWSTTAIGRSRFLNLRRSEPASVSAYREIVAGKDSYIAGEAAERLAEIGEPSMDIPLLRNALERFGNESPGSEKIQAALLKLQGKNGAV